MSILTELISRKYTLVGTGKYLKTLEHDSLVIDTEKDVFYWNSLEIIGDGYVWLTKVEKLPHHEAKKILTDLQKDEHVYVHSVSKSGKEVIVYPKLVNIFWDSGRENRDYWYGRGYTDDTINRFQLGFYNGWYTIPFFIDGTFRNFQIRRDEPNKKIKSWYTGVGALLFNADVLKLTDVIFITESPTDAIILSQHGYPAVSQNGGAGYWTPTWFRYFINQKEIYIVYDNDLAGLKGAKRVANSLGQYRCKIFTFPAFENRYDVGDWFKDPLVDKDTFYTLVKREGKYLFEL